MEPTERAFDEPVGLAEAVFRVSAMDSGHSTLQTAITETLEESGCLIDAALKRIGEFEYKKRFGGRERRFCVDFFSSTIIEVCDRYRESTLRERAFITPIDAARMLTSP